MKMQGMFDHEQGERFAVGVRERAEGVQLVRNLRANSGVKEFVADVKAFLEEAASVVGGEVKPLGQGLEFGFRVFDPSGRALNVVVSVSGLVGIGDEVFIEVECAGRVRRIKGEGAIIFWRAILRREVVRWMQHCTEQCAGGVPREYLPEPLIQEADDDTD